MTTAEAKGDDARDALALVRAYIDDDDHAIDAVLGACDLGGVIGFLIAWQAETLTIAKGGETGLRRWLDHIQNHDVVTRLFTEGGDEAS